MCVIESVALGALDIMHRLAFEEELEYNLRRSLLARRIHG